MPKRNRAKTTRVTPAVVSNFPIVGIGASAGGLAAFEAFFSGIPLNIDPGMAFVLVQHLSPDHTSMLAELVQRYTRMVVVEVEDGMKVEPNCVYIIPPGRNMAFLNGSLQLLEPTAGHGHRLPIDFFFHSLAQDLHERSIGIILSGTGSDGTQGISAIKEEGGMVMAQTPETTEYDGMPLSAIATGLVDSILSPSEMANQLIVYTVNTFGNHEGYQTGSQPKFHNMMDKIFILLRSQTGHDFSQYKPSTIGRRIERRLAIHQIESIDEYVKYLQQTPLEVEALFHDLLIGVTNFFRDPEAFVVLQEVILPKLFALKAEREVLRIWCVGCSTGEEAYSIAILLKEHMETQQLNVLVQLFATDIDAHAIAIARSGIYPAAIAADISPERLKRFFIAEPDGSYRIHKSIRDMLIFSEQNISKDPPFSKLDLISCRNLLIYMNSDLQKKIIPLFHYALNPEGILFLGSSESIGEFSNLFTILDQKSKFFQCKEEMNTSQRTLLDRTLLNAGITRTFAMRTVEKNNVAEKLPLRELMEQTLLRRIPLSGAIVNEQGDIVYLHGRTGMYLELPTGEMGVYNILKTAREGLRRDLTMALHAAISSHESVSSNFLHVQNLGMTLTLHLSSKTALRESPLYIVIFEEVIPEHSITEGAIEYPALGTKPTDEGKRIAMLQQELYEQEAFLQIANRKLETSNEELKSYNEEMQSLNEELQSTNEELETSKEELQSLNEELSTVNTELQTKVADLSHANNDMNNLLAGTNIGTVFVDHKLCILRFTPAVTNIIHLILTDLGRPVGHIASNMMGYDTFVSDIQSVLNTLIPKEAEVQTREGKWYSMRIQPYRTIENVIEGAVISFIDISEIVQMREELQKANRLSRLAIVVHDAIDAITVQDLDGHMLAWNPGAVRMYGWSEEEALRMNVRDRIAGADREEEIFKIKQLSRSEILEPYSSQRICKDRSVSDVRITSTALVNSAGEMYAIATTERLIPKKNTKRTDA
ncbi:MAG: PAS domain-containing protein [Sulfuricurvum sp.]|uniref:chemotaxis protein CheB n=1 Tax=Sulfuricurvum sp. TaxID=2025608 RepID=UPI0025DE2B9B|nr:chemotaxis protein CheB [Sulfuricurvum sp.]MCK9372971.1 PAS domain-containing protein [Sulfuricurvum sp.]